MFWRRRTPGWGREIVGEVYSGDDVQRLNAAIDTLALRYGTPVAERLADELLPAAYQGPRAAVNALRREALAAIPAIPALAAWARASIGNIPDDWAGYAVREVFFTLGDLRRLAVEQGRSAEGPVREALVVVASLLDGDVEGTARALADPSVRASRGAIAYLQGARGDVPAALAALESYLDRHPGQTGDGDVDHARGDAIRAFQELSQRVEIVRAEPQAPLLVERPFPPPHTQLAWPDEDGVDEGACDAIAVGRVDDSARARAEVGALLIERATSDPDSNVRVAALDALGRELATADALVALVRACLSDADPGIRLASVRLLGRLGREL